MRTRSLGVDVDAVTMDDAVRTVTDWLESPGDDCRYVVTPNVDHAVRLRDDAAMRRAYADASLVVADGMPLVWASRLGPRRVPERVAGSDLTPAVLAAAPIGTRVFLLGGTPAVTSAAARNVERDFPRVAVAGTASPPLGFERASMWSRTLATLLSETRPALVLVGLGAPKQELWVHEHRDLLRGTVALCVGATIEFLAGTKPRAPAWMGSVGLEWTHRLMSEPSRLASRYAKDAMLLPRILVEDGWERLRT